MINSSIPRQKLDSNILKNIPFFSTLTDEAICEVEQVIVKKRYARDQIILFEEDTSSYMYLVYSGKVRVVQLNDEGREHIITFHKKNDFFGEMSLLDGKTSPSTVIAHEDAVIGLLSKNDFDQHLLSNEEIRRKIMDLLCARLRDSWAMIRILSFDNAEQRIMAVLDRLKDLYGVKDQRGYIIALKLTHSQIANYASVSRETVTRTLNRFMRNDEIEFLGNKHILIKNSIISKLKSQF
jgi:CRP-like cAMP-binding protein